MRAANSPSAAARRDKLRNALEAWDPSLRSPARSQQVVGTGAKDCTKKSLSLESPDRAQGDDTASSESWWMEGLPHMVHASSMDFRSSDSRLRKSKVGDADNAADVSAQVLGRVLALLKGKENKWRNELHRSSVLEGENSELRARLAAAEQNNLRLRSRLHSGVAAFHRTLSQAKEKLEAKETELARVKALSLQLQGKIESNKVETSRLRQQVALLHKWCSSSSSPLFTVTPADMPSSRSTRGANSQREKNGAWGWYDEIESEDVRDKRRHADNDRFSEYEDDASPPLSPYRGGGAGRRGGRRSGSRRVERDWGEWDDGELDHGGQELRVGDEEEEQMRKRLEELATLRALRRAFERRSQEGREGDSQCNEASSHDARLRTRQHSRALKPSRARQGEGQEDRGERGEERDGQQPRAGGAGRERGGGAPSLSSVERSEERRNGGSAKNEGKTEGKESESGRRTNGVVSDDGDGAQHEEEEEEEEEEDSEQYCPPHEDEQDGKFSDLIFEIDANF